ncbi:hypothetical protein A8A11_04075 [Escherichia coli]|nr:hypothetical protein A8A11_04075 [Escherichia coli]
MCRYNHRQFWLWLPDIAGGTPATVLGIPYVIDQAIDGIGTGKKFIFLGDFNRFIIRRVTYMELKRLVERYAEFDQVHALPGLKYSAA